MVEKFKKGQIVPRRLKMVVSRDRKAQHQILFGTDVEVIGRKVRALSETGVLFYFKSATRRMANGTRKSTVILEAYQAQPWVSVNPEHGFVTTNTPVVIAHRATSSQLA